MKKFFSVLGLIVLVSPLLVFAGGQQDKAADKDETVQIEIWSWAAPEMQTVADAVQPEFPNVEFVINAFPGKDYQTKIRNALRAKSDKPDLYYMGDESTSDLFANGLAADLKEYGFDPEILRGHYYDHALDIGSHEGKFHMVGWKAAPSVMFYNSKKAIEYFGTDDPGVIGEMTKTWDGFKEMCRIVSEKSGGQDIAAYGLNIMARSYLRSSNQAIVAKDGKINTPLIRETVSYMKDIIDMKTAADDEGGSGIARLYAQDRVFGVCAAPWALQYWMKQGIPESSGEWRSTYLSPSFQGYWGLIVNPYSKNKQIATDVIKTFTTKPELGYSLLAPTNDFPVDARVVDMMKNDKVDYLGGQNPIPLWMESAKKIEIGASFEYNSNMAINLVNDIASTMIVDPTVSADAGVKMFIDSIKIKVPGSYE